MIYPKNIILWQRCLQPLILRCACDILNAVLHFARDVKHFAFCVGLCRHLTRCACISHEIYRPTLILCMNFLDLGEVLKKRGKLLKMCVST